MDVNDSPSIEYSAEPSFSWPVIGGMQSTAVQTIDPSEAALYVTCQEDTQ